MKIDIHRSDSASFDVTSIDTVCVESASVNMTGIDVIAVHFHRHSHPVRDEPYLSVSPTLVWLGADALILAEVEVSSDTEWTATVSEH